MTTVTRLIMDDKKDDSGANRTRETFPGQGDAAAEDGGLCYRFRRSMHVVIGERPLIADSSAQANRAPMPPAAACQILLTCLSVCSSGASSPSINHTAIMPIVMPISPARAIPTRPSAKAKSPPVASAPLAVKKPRPRARSPTAALLTPTSFFP